MRTNLIAIAAIADAVDGITSPTTACRCDAPSTCATRLDIIVAETCSNCSASSFNDNCRPTSTMGECAYFMERAWRPLMKWEIETQVGTVTFSTWGHPTSIEWVGQGWLLVIDEEGPYWVKFDITLPETSPATKRAPMRRNRMSHHGEADRRASRLKPDNSWKNHRQTQWR